jgi:hypothetical protein
LTADSHGFYDFCTRVKKEQRSASGQTNNRNPFDPEFYFISFPRFGAKREEPPQSANARSGSTTTTAP